MNTLVLSEVTDINPIIKLTLTTLPTISCFYKDCEVTQSNLVLEAFIFIVILFCILMIYIVGGNSKHDLFFNILDEKVNRFKINPKNDCMSPRSIEMIYEIAKVLLASISGLSLNYLSDYLLQCEYVPLDFIIVL